LEAAEGDTQNEAKETVARACPPVEIFAAASVKIMAQWYKQYTSELASLETLLRCGRQDVITAWFRVVRHAVEREADEVPESMRGDLELLAEFGFAVAFGERCKDLVDQREATKRWRSTRAVASRDITQDHVASRGTTESHEISGDILEEKRIEKREKRERKPRAERTAKPSLETWSPNDSHRELAKQRGVDVEREATKMRDWLLANGKRYKDYDAGFRNWLERARPEPVGRPTLVRPNLSNNLLQHDNHPEGAGEEYWLQGIEKYKYGGTNG